MSTKRRSNSRRPGAARTTSRPTTRTGTAGRPATDAGRPAGPPAPPPTRPVAPEASGPLAGEQLPPTGALYPQVLRTPDRSPLRTMGGIVIGVSAYLIVLSLINRVVIAIGHLLVGRQESYSAFFADATAFRRPTGFLAANLAIAALIPISMLLVGFVHRVRPRWLSSVQPRLRWRYLGLCLLAGLVALGGVQLLSQLAGPPVVLRPQPGFWTFLIMIVLTSPLQAAGEEYFFRGYLLQAFGSLVANPWFGIVLSSLIFTAAHLAFSPALFLDRLAFGVAAAVLVRLTGGLEAGIAAHVVNNLIAFTVAGLTTGIASVQHVSAISWLTGVVDIGSFALFAVLAWLIARAVRLRTRTDLTGVIG